MSNILKTKKFKHGALSVFITIAFVALVIAFNLIVSAVSTTINLKVDMTKENFIRIGSETETLLNALGDDLSVTIYFLTARDRFDSAENEYNGLNLTGLVRDLAEEYSYRFDGKIKVEYKDISIDPKFASTILDETNTALSASNVIIKGKYHSRVLALPAFFNTDDEGKYVAFNGEYKFTAAILQSSISEPQVVALTTGHGETPSDSLKSLLSGAGFEVQTVDLDNAELDPRTRIVIVANPRYDFTMGETDKLINYVNAFNSLMVFVDSSTPALKNLQDYLKDFYSIGYVPYHEITDESNSVLNNVRAVLAQYVKSDLEDDSSAAYQIHKNLTAIGGATRTVLPDSVLLFKDTDNPKNSYTVETVLSTSDSAQMTYYDDNDAQVTEKGSYPLMLLSTRSYYDNDESVYKYGYVSLISSTEFAKDGYLGTASYGNDRIILSTARIMGTKAVSPSIDYIKFGETALDLDTGTAYTLTAIVCILLPLIITVLGIVMFFKRRHL